MYFQDLVLNLQQYWTKQGCLLAQPYDLEKGAGTFNPATFLRSLGPEPFSSVYIEPCRRPTDGRYGKNPLRLQHYYQLQVILKPSPDNIIDLYLDSLRAIGIAPEEHDIRFVHDDWETTALGAWGLGWEVWFDGTEVTQFTYFQQIGGIELSLIPGEITYGLERICMFLQKVDNVFDLKYNESLTYGDIYHQNEIQFSKHNFEIAPIDLYLELFQKNSKLAQDLCEQQLPIPALDYVIKASHCFNILDARNAISVRERQDYILQIRTLAQQVSLSWLDSRKALNYPLLKNHTIQENISTHKRVSPNTTKKNGSFLLEIGVEEMPAQIFPSLHKQLPELWKKYITPLNLKFSKPKFYSTPRRISILTDSVNLQQKNTSSELKGPPLNIAQDKNGEWTQIAKGFVKKNQQILNDVIIKKIGKFDYLTLNIQNQGQTAFDLLKEELPLMLSKIHWYNTMRWGQGNQTPFVRPIRWIVAMIDESVIPLSFCGIESNNKSYGHRFLSPQPFVVSVSNYERDLFEKFVIVNQHQRKDLLHEKLTKTAQKQNLSLLQDSELLEEVNQLIEYPFPVLGHFEKKYLNLPQAVIISEMKEHQKYFAVQEKSKELAPNFIAVSNMNFSSFDSVSHGFSNVLNSRLFDGDFFLKEDSKQPLATFSSNLSQMTFVSKMGSMKDKVDRITTIAVNLAKKLNLPTETIDSILVASSLCKNDLTSKMVFEFPNLQGTIGRHYAQNEDYSNSVCTAIEEHYLPKDATDNLPSKIEGSIIGIADRLDTILSLFLINKKPTGSTDPYALRRSCIACLHLLIQNKINLSLSELFSIVLEQNTLTIDNEKISEITTFFNQRFKHILLTNDRKWLQDSLSHHQVEAFLVATTPWENISQTIQRIQAISQFSTQTLKNLTVAIKRISNLLENHKEPLTGECDQSLFSEKAEQEIFNTLTEKQNLFEESIKNSLYSESLKQLINLETKIHKLFEEVIINHSDPKIKTNRLKLIQKIHHMSLLLLDFNSLQ